MAAAVRAGVPGVKRRLRSGSRVGVAGLLIAAVVVALVAKSDLDVAVGWISAPLGGLHSLRRARVQGGRHAGLADIMMGQGSEASADSEKPATEQKPGVRDLKSLEQLEKGSTVDGRVARRTSAGVFLDIGAAKPALLKAPKEEAFKLEPNETLKGLTIESVRLGDAKQDQQVDVSFAGLSELVADRPERPSSQTRKKTSAEDGKTKQTVDTDPRWVLDGNDLKGKDGAKVVVELRGGLTISSANKNQQTITLIKGPDSSDKSPEQKGKGKAKPNRSIGDPFADLVEGQSLKGRVRNKNNLGVWIDVGKERDVLYESHEKMYLLDWGEELNVVVSTVNHELGQARVTLPDLEQHVAGREQKLTALKDLEVGSVVTGHVATIRGFGSYVNIGAEKEAFIGARVTRKTPLELGKEVKLRLMSIDMDKQQLEVELVKDGGDDDANKGGGDEMLAF